MGYYKRLRDLREDYDIGQKNASDIIGKCEKQYGRYERGETDIPFEDVIKLARYYKVSLDYIAELTNNPKNNTIVNNNGKVANSGNNNTFNMNENKRTSKFIEIALEQMEKLKEEQQLDIVNYIYKLKNKM